MQKYTIVLDVPNFYRVPCTILLNLSAIFFLL
jgi:hypothetical protein